MLDDLNSLERERFQYQLNSRHPCGEYSINQKDPKFTMPRKISYKPVRYFPRKKVYTSSHSKDQYRAKESNMQVNHNYQEYKGQTSQIPEEGIHSYPINNILVLPQNSDALINVISQNEREFSYKKYFRRKAKGKSNSCKNTSDSNCDVKPNINKIKFKNYKKPNVNRHTIILSDSEDDISSERTTNNENINQNSADMCGNVNDNVQKNDEVPLSADDDVILVENEAANEVIEIDDNNMEQDTPEAIDITDECNAVLSTPESSTSNDFLENSQLNQNPKFNFSLHGSEFKDSEFLRPTINVDISESGSISSISDISNSLKTNVFNLVDFPKEKDSLFDENNLEKFKNAITPQRHIKKTCTEDHSNLSEKADIYGKKHLPTLSDIGTDYKTHKRVRGRSVIRELVNDRAYILLSSAEKKMKSKKRKSKDCVSNSSKETEITEVTATTSAETSKKKKRKKMKKKEVSLAEENGSYLEFMDNNFSTSSLETNTPKNKKYELSGNHNPCENWKNHLNMHSNGLMIRTDLFPEEDVDKHEKNKSETSNCREEILEKSEITFKQKQKKNISVQVVDTDDFRKRSKKDKSLTAFTEKDEYSEHKTLKKLDKVGKKNIQHKKEEQIELANDIDASSIEKKRKRKKEQRISEGEVLDSADGEISSDICSISKRKPKKKRLSVNHETENCQPTEVEDNNFDVNINTPEKVIRQKTLSNTEIPSEALHIHENSSLLTNLDKSPIVTCTEHDQKIDETELNITECKLVNNEENDKTQISPSECLSDKVEISSSLDYVEMIESVTYNENPSVDKDCNDSKESIRTMLRDIENPKQLLNGVQSTKSIFSEENSKTSCKEKSNCINKSEEKNCCTAETAFAVCEVSEPWTVSDKISNIKLEEIEVLHSTVDNSVELSQISTSFSCKSENTEIVSLPTQLEIIDLSDTSLHKHNQTNVVHLDEESKNSEHLPIEKDHEKCIDQVLKIKPEKLERIAGKEKQEFKLGSVESNLPLVSVEQECENNVLGIKEKLPDVIEKIFSKEDPIASMRKLCEYLEEVNDPQDVLKKVSMIKEAFLAKSVAEVKSSSIIEELVSDDDILSVSSDSSSSVVCLASDTPDVDIIDDLTLINCESSTLVEEVKENNEGVEKEIFVVNETCFDEDRTITKDDDTCNNTRKHDTSSVLHFSKAGSHERSLDEYDVEDIQQLMSNDQKLWEISPKDLPQKQFVPKGKRCIKCKEIGHLAYNCPNKSNLPKCILCGVAGHLDFKCPNRICTQCGRNSSIMKNACQNCKHYRSLTCSLCKMRGHPRNKCPDLWRRYHLTVEHGELVKSEGMKLKEKEDLWCSFCAKLGHFDVFCSSARRTGNFQQLDPRIHDYKDIYGSHDNENDKNTRSKNRVSRNRENVQTVDKHVDSPDNECTKIYDENISHGLSYSKEITPCFKTGCTQDNSVHESSLLVTSFATSSAIVEFEGPHQDIAKGGNCGIHTSLNENSETAVTVPNVYEKINNEPVAKISNNVSSSTVVKSIQTHPLKLTEKVLPKKSKVQSKSKLKYKTLDPNSLNFFIESNKEDMKTHIRNELELLKNASFEIDELYKRFIAYKEDELMPRSKRKIPLSEIQTLHRTLNMMLFGRAQLKSGCTHLSKLESALEKIRNFNPSFRKSLCYSFEYIFGQSKIPNINYKRLIESLRKKYGRNDIPSEATTFIEESEPLKMEDVNSSNISSVSSKTELKNDKKDFKSDILTFFIETEIGTLKNYVINELKLLQKRHFSIRNLYNKYLAYRKTLKTPGEQSKISLCYKRKLIKSVNMMLFGRYHFKFGTIHYQKLVAFVDTPGDFCNLSETMRESLYCSYEYIFGQTEHEHVNYIYLMELLLRQYKYKPL